MNFKIQQPHPVLQPLIHHYAVGSLGFTNEWSTIAMAPTGCGVLGVVVGDQKFLYRAEENSDPSHASLLSLAGQLTNFKELQLFDHRVMVYAVLKPCAAFRLFSISQHYCTNLSSDLLDLLPANERHVQHQFEECQTPEESLLVLENLLLKLLMGQKEKPQLTRIIAISDYLNQHSHESIPLKRICGDAGFSKSTLERHFNEFVGIGPKQYHRIVRFNNVLKHIRQQNQFRHWTEVVYRFGYYDQAHFIKDFKLLYGKSPSEFSSNDDLLSSII